MRGAADGVGEIRQVSPQTAARHRPLAFRILTLPRHEPHASSPSLLPDRAYDFPNSSIMGSFRNTGPYGGAHRTPRSISQRQLILAAANSRYAQQGI